MTYQYDDPSQMEPLQIMWCLKESKQWMQNRLLIWHNNIRHHIIVGIFKAQSVICMKSSDLDKNRS